MKTVAQELVSLKRQFRVAAVLGIALLCAGTVVLTTIVTINADGSASMAALTMGATADPDTGLFHPAANKLSVTAGGTETVRVNKSDATHGSLGVLSSGNSNAFCITATGANNIDCDPTAANPAGLYFDDAFIASLDTFGNFGQLQIAGANLSLSADGATPVVVTSATFLQVNNNVAGSAAQIQTAGLVASTSPLVPFSLGPTAAATASLALGIFTCTQRCTVTRGWGKALTQGTVGSTAPTITVGTCTLTSGSGCNAAANTNEAFTASGTCTFAAGTVLDVALTKGDCTVGPSFFNIGVEINNQ